MSVDVSITKAELLKALEPFPDDMEVRVQGDCDIYWKIYTVEKTQYRDGNFDDDPEDENTTWRDCILISAQ